MEVISKFSNSKKEEPKKNKLKLRKGVSFGKVNTHTHNRVMGDNPSVGKGLPVSFDWEVQASDSFKLEEYEELLKKEHALDGIKKGKCPRRLEAYERYSMICEAGHSHASMARMDKEIRKLKKSMTKPGETMLEDDCDDCDGGAFKSKKMGFLAGFFPRKNVPKKTTITCAAA